MTWILLTFMALLLAHFAVAFVTLDLFFRSISVNPVFLRRRLKFWGRVYAGVASFFAVTGAWAGFQDGGWLLLVAILLGPIPWWLLWRFGLAKQFPFLKGPNGGSAARKRKPAP